MVGNCVEKNAGNGFTQAELQYEGPYNGSNSNKYDNHYEGIVKWFKLSDEKMQKRYVRLSVYDTFWILVCFALMKCLHLTERMYNNKFSKL